MAFFSKDLVAVLRGLDQPIRNQILQSMHQRLRCPDVYKLLTLLLGFFGIHKLYLNEVSGVFLRLNYIVAALIAGGTGLYFSNLYLLFASATIFTGLGALWLFDVVTPHLAMKRYYGQMEHVVMRWHQSQVS